MNNIGVVFDFNGTLFHDSDKHEKAWRQFFKNEFNRDVNDEEFKKYVHGRKWKMHKKKPLQKITVFLLW